MPDASTFGARLAMVRQAMGWGNVKQAAELCGVPPASWRGWERDGLMPRSLITVAMKISGVTGVDYRWLALGPDSRAEVSRLVAAEVTGGYPAIGERVVARIGPPTVHRGVRARPLGLRISA